MNPELYRTQLKNIFQNHPVRLAYLFGSQATGCVHSESDIDVAMLLDESLSTDDRFKERLAIIGELSKLFQTDHVDVAVLNEASPLLAYEVLKNGVLLYCKSEEERIEFQVNTLRTYEDTAPLRRILNDAMAERVRAGTFGKPQLARRK